MTVPQNKFTTGSPTFRGSGRTTGAGGSDSWPASHVTQHQGLAPRDENSPHWEYPLKEREPEGPLIYNRLIVLVELIRISQDHRHRLVMVGHGGASSGDVRRSRDFPLPGGRRGFQERIGIEAQNLIHARLKFAVALEITLVEKTLKRMTRPPDTFDFLVVSTDRRRRVKLGIIISIETTRVFLYTES